MGNKRKASNETDKDSDASSGYYSALEQTDCEDAGPTSTAAPRGPFLPASHPAVSRMIVMNNLALKQPNSAAPALKPWSLNASLDVDPQSQLLFLQPVRPSSDQSGQSSDTQTLSRKHVPMQNTLAKIVPHPAEESTVDSAVSKRTNHSHGARPQRHCYADEPFHCSSLKQDDSETCKGYGIDPDVASLGDVCVENCSSRLSDPQEPHTTLCTHSFLASFPQKCPRSSDTQSSDVENISEDFSTTSSKRKRFCNTYNILNRSGLLGITLRTKELIRQNKRSQAQLQSLQAQTDLFLEAMCSGDPKAWTRLQLILQSSRNSEETPVESVKDAEEESTDTACVL